MLVNNTITKTKSNEAEETQPLFVKKDAQMIKPINKDQLFCTNGLNWPNNPICPWLRI